MRLRQVEAELGGQIELVWKSFLLRPEPQPGRDLETFRTYTESWMRPAADEDAPGFRVWQGSAGPPSHSLPPQLVARAAARLGRAAFDALHERLLRAYFEESRDVTDRETLRTVWGEAGLPEAAFESADDPAIREAVLADYREALELEVNGVPAVRLEPNPVAMLGALPIETYRRWFAKALAARGGGS